MGWEPIQVTLYEYNEQGLVTSSQTHREAEWDDQERALAAALLAYEADRCPGCGGYMHDTIDPETEGRWHVPEPTRCHRCTAIAVKQEGYKETPNPQALLWSASIQK